MTCLIATREGVWADRRESAGATVYRPTRKVVVGRELVAAFCGGSAACVRAMRSVQHGETDPQVLARISDGLLVTESGTIWELWGKVATRAPRSAPFACHGSGCVEAQAYLSGARDCTADAIRRALRYVARVRSDCGDGYDALRLREYSSSRRTRRS